MFLKVLAIETGSLMYFSSLVINEGVSLFFCLIDTKKFMKYFSLALLKSVDKRFL